VTDERIALVVRRLASTLPPNRVVQDPERLASYESDWTRRYRGRAGLVVLPETTEEVSLVMRTCHELQVPVVPQGGNTGLVGGGVPRSGEVVVSLSRMQGVEPVDAASGQVTVEAGVTLSSLQQHVRARGFDVGIDFAARDSATLGGIAATDAGGERVVRYGKARRHIAGLEAVLASGEVITRLTGLPKDNVGYDLRHLLVGSEGTLGVITRLRIQLTPLVPCRATALLAVGSLEDAVAVTSRVRHELETLESVELFFDEGLDLVCRHVGLPAPMPERHDVYLLIECADRRDPT
jgi:FAD/FMN-containing dehydrogenase